MNTTELTTEINKKYPSVWEKLVYFANQNYKFAHALCYCAIEDFFEENGIIITISYDPSLYKSWDYHIYTKGEYNYKTANDWFKTKLQAKYQAILKASEILGDKL